MHCKSIKHIMQKNCMGFCMGKKKAAENRGNFAAFNENLWSRRESNLTVYVSINQLIVILFMPKGTKCSPLFILNANSYF